MIFSEQWLREWVNPKLETQQLIDELTMAGLEVDGSNAVAHNFSGIVVGLVESIKPHPDGDKLSLCKVSDGAEYFQVVCGAPNVRVGLKVPFATLGAEIHRDDEKPFKIKKVKLRGIESNGMLCSADELGLTEISDGLLELPDDAPVGENVRSYLNLDDTSIELDLTPNRGDCLGMIGLAREVGVLARKKVVVPEVDAVVSTLTDEFSVNIIAKDECPRYLGRVIRHINPNAESPLWMQEKLRRSGLRSIDPVVDVTNFVLMELGQPMHAFDLSKLEGNIEVRLADKNEKLTLLDGKEVGLTPDTLVIADKNKVVAMAGVIGGLDTAVTDKTEDVFLECAFFAPLAIAGKARSYGMHTDASHRYERGVDYELQQRAMERGTQLLLEIAGGESGPITEAIGNLPAALTINLKYRSISRLLGMQIEQREVRDILTRLGFKLLAENPDSLTVEVPSFRFDVSLEADLIEELARIVGYNNLPKTAGMASQRLKSRPEAETSIGRIREYLVTLGYQEVVTYSFIDPAMAELVCPGDDLIPLQNPISADMSVMRSSILPGLLSTLKYNENRQQERMRLFESGLVFTRRDGEIEQKAKIAGLIYGLRSPVNWNNNKELSDFYDVKGHIESLLSLSRGNSAYSFSAVSHGCFHTGQCAAVEQNGQLIGHIGSLHPTIQRNLGINSETYLFELDLDAIRTRDLPVASALSKFPEVSRDLAIVIDDEVSAAAVINNVRDNAGEYLTNLRIFDVYQGDAVKKGKKSIALGLTWQHPSRTLSDDDIGSIISNCVKELEDKFNANLRN
jgi:phenylalanyl-tRNA synthetase beta chain